MRPFKLPLFARMPGPLYRGAARGAGSSRLGAWLTAGAVVALVAGCGGGGGGGGDAAGSSASGTVPAATASAFTQGTITGLGSIIVNGVRFDETGASVTDDAGQQRPASALALGMRVEVDSGAVDAASATAHAAAVRYGSLVLGPVAAVDSAASTLMVLGQVVDVGSSTVFSDGLAAGLSAVTVGALVEVHGLANTATGHLTATRVESATGATAYKLRGSVAGLDTLAKTFSIGGATVSYSGLAASAVPTTLVNGVTLRVLLATAQSGGVWVAQSLGVKGNKPADRAVAQVRGSITAFTSINSFSVDGLAVDASSASFPDGSSGLALGVQVEVQGAMSNGVLVATRVSLESRHQGDDSHACQLIGAITAVDVTAKTFVVRGVTVSYGDATTYVNGSLADLTVGRKVHITGAVGSRRNQVQARVVSFD